MAKLLGGAVEALAVLRVLHTPLNVNVATLGKFAAFGLLDLQTCH